MNPYANEMFVKGERESHTRVEHGRGRKFRFDAINRNEVMFIL